MAGYNTFRYNTTRYNAGGPRGSFLEEMQRLRDAIPLVKIEWLDPSGNANDVSRYYVSGGNVSRLKDRALDEVQAGDFDVTFWNTDGTFSEFISTSLLFGVAYHGTRLRVWLGFRLSDGTVDYRLMQTGYVDQLLASDAEDQVTFRCRDLVGKLLDVTIHRSDDALVPVAAAANTGNGKVSSVQTKPFETVSETWTLTCTTRGADGTAVFSVVGSVSGNVGNATSGTTFDTVTNGIGGVKFTVTAGTTPWENGDVWTWTTAGYPQWTSQNPMKIVWSVLTGTSWDTGAAESFAGLVLALDGTRSSANAQIDYDQFAVLVTAFADVAPVTGYLDYDQVAATFLHDLLVLYLGSLYTGLDGRLRLAAYRPVLQVTEQGFADTLQVTAFGYQRTLGEVINHVSVTYKKTATGWPYTGDSQAYDGLWTQDDATSQAAYGQFAQAITTLWVTADGSHASDLAGQLLNRYAQPPLTLEFKTGLDAALLNLGDRISATDAKYGLSAAVVEVTGLTKTFDATPMNVQVVAKRDADTSLTWAFLGSSADEGDGESPQASDFDSASAVDKNFAYLSQDGGEGTPPDYRLF